MATTFEERLALWETAMGLPVARPDDFVALRPPDEAHAYLRVVRDAKLRSRLLAIGMAEPMQIPRGRSPLAPIVRLRPNLDARRAPAEPQPTVEDLRDLLARIEVEERSLRGDRDAALQAEIDLLRRRIASGAADDDLSGAVAELGSLLRLRDEAQPDVRREAFRRISEDADFAPRRFLRMLETRETSRGPRRAAHAARPQLAHPAPAAEHLDPDSPAARRAAYRAAWHARLMPVLTADWQSAETIANALREKRKSVLERMGDLVRAGVAERRIVTLPPKPVAAKKRGRVRRRNIRLLDAQFRLAVRPG